MTNQEKKEYIRSLKDNSGTHSPSIGTILDVVGEDTISIDACFLSNPYATELFIKNLNSLIRNEKKWHRTLEFYPPQNQEIARKISKKIKVDHKNIIVGNGAIELIQTVVHNYVKENVAIITPTFSPYYEFVGNDVEIYYYELNEENNFILDVDDYIQFIRLNKIKNIVLINPNNPNGAYLEQNKIDKIINSLQDVDNIILDESFVDFAYESSDFESISNNKYLDVDKNVFIIRSMSKDFGIAGIRAGYMLTNEKIIKEMLSSGYLWNVSGLASYFFDLYCREDFQKKYETVRKKYILNTLIFIEELRLISIETGIRIYPSKANFVLLRLPEDFSKNSQEVMTDLLIDYGLYVRDCSDKIGLGDRYLRVASRSIDENVRMVEILSDYFGRKGI